MSESAPLAIVGISCLFPKADDLQAYWRNIKNGTDAISAVPDRSHWKVDDYFNPDPKAPDQTYARRGGFLSPVDFNPMEFGIAPKDVEATDTTQLLGLVAAKRALDDAGYGEKPFDKTRTSVILGVTGALELVIPLGARLGHPIWRRALKEAGVDSELAEDVVQRISDSYVGWQENSFPGLLGNVAAGRIASRLDLGGTNCVVDAACASSLAALHLAALELTSNRSDMVITGGIDTFNDIFMYMCFSKTPALSPSGDAKPFDRQCDGTILGEGIGMVVLKRLADAEKDGDRIYAIIKGIGSSSDGRGNAIYAPRADGQKEALRRAYQQAGVHPSTISLIEAHGTGTKVGDATEVNSLTEVYRESGTPGTWAALGSVKSQIGHTKAAAGVAGLIKAALALQNKVLPPTIKVTTPVDELAPGKSPFYINTQKRPWLPSGDHPRRAGVSSFGFGGTNFHCVLEEHKRERTSPDWDGEVEILAFCASVRDELRDTVAQLPDELAWPQLRSKAFLSRSAFDPKASLRLLVPLMRSTTLGSVRDAILLMLDRHPDKAQWVLPNGAAFASGPKKGRLGALFPGQGSQYVGMLRDLACQFPPMLEALSAADRVFAKERGAKPSARLSDFIYPQTAFTEEARKENEEALKATDVAQPALGAVGLGAMNVLGYFGITPEAAAGQSYGELLALCGAGRLKPEALHLLSNVRGRLMASGSGRGDRGAMLTVQASEDAVTRFLGEEDRSLVIANRNSPSQFVLAGPKPEIERAATQLAQRSVRAKVLKVSAAFHSSLVADACEPFAAVLESVPFSRGRIPVYANATAREYPSNARQARELLTSQIVKPVDFMAQIETMFADGVTTFVEMGPGHVLSDLVQAILPGKDVATVALDASKGSRSGVFDLAATLCRLAALGHPVDLARWENPPESVQAKASQTGKPTLTIPLSGANHRSTSAPVRPPRPALARPSVSPALSASAPSTQPNPAPVQETHARSMPMPPAHVNTNSASTAPARSAMQPSSPYPASVPLSNPALSLAEQGLLTLQKMQEQTAQLHRQFLENQDAARRTLESLLAQRSSLLSGASVPSVPSPSPSPVAVVQQPTPLSAAPTPPNPVPRTAVSVTPAPKLAGPSQPSPIVRPPSGPSRDLIARAVLDVVAEKTGYPSEMLNLDMGLDSDLGVDSIKRVEIMAALRGRLPGTPEIKPEHLGTLQTLLQVVDFLATPNPSSGLPTESSAAHAQGAVVSSLGSGPVQRSTPSLGVAAASQALLAVVAEKTGYPVEMLSLDMGLDSDLGVDSIKRVEIMASLRTQLPDAPEIKPEHLGSLQTLRHIVDFLTASNPTHGSPGSDPTAASPSSVSPEGTSSAAAAAALLQVVAEKTGYPAEMLTLEMGLDSDLGIDSIKRVEIMAALKGQLPHAPEIKPEHLGSLQTLRQIVDFLAPNATAQPVPNTPPTTPRPTLSTSSRASSSVLQRQVLRAVPLQLSKDRPAISLDAGSLAVVCDEGTELGTAVVTSLTGRGLRVVHRPLADLMASAEPNAAAALVVIWPGADGDDQWLLSAFQLLQRTASALRSARDGQGGIFATVSRLDGAFGLGTLEAHANALGGGLAGLSKTAAHEWPNVLCKAFDVAVTERSLHDTAATLVDEMFRRGPAEVGVSGTHRTALSIESKPVATNGAQKVLETGDVVVVTGGARGITGTAILELAKAHQPRLVLLGRSPNPSPEPEWLAGITSESGIKKALATRAETPRSPRQLEAEFREVMALREIRSQLKQLQAVGATAVYRSLDVRDAAATRAVINQIRQDFGPIRGVVHGAGVLADKRIEDKTPEQFAQVYGTKVDGLRNLLEALQSEHLALIALFSSYTGRFGRVGQVDYAVANEVLNKLAQAESRRRPDCRVVSFNWGPWNGGMVSDGLRKIFESEGVGLIEPDAGARFFVNEVSSHAERAVEVLAIATTNPSTGSTASPNDSSAPPAEDLNLAFERPVGIRSVPCLASHILNGRAVLPAALMMEWLAEAALQNNPGLEFGGIQQFKVFKGLILNGSAEVSLRFMTGNATLSEGSMTVPVEMWSGTTTPRTLHAKAEVVLVDSRESAPRDFRLSLPDQPIPSFKSAYLDGRLFHGPWFQAIEDVVHCDAHSIHALTTSAPQPNQWVENPCRPNWILDPLGLDAAFQLMILWSWEHRTAPCLPCGVRSFRQFRSAFPTTGLRVVVEDISADSNLTTANIRFLDRSGNLIAVVEGFESVIDPGLKKAFQQNRLQHEEQV